MATPLLLQQFVEADRAPVRGWNDVYEFVGQEVSARGTKHEARLDKSRNLRALLPMESLRVLPSDGVPSKELVDLPMSRLAAAAGYRHASSYARLVRRCPELITTRRVWGSPSARQWNFRPSARPRGKRPWKGHNMPSARELAQHPALGKFFAGAKAGGGYHLRPGFIHHPRFPGTPNDRIVLSQLADQGIFEGKHILDDVTQVELSAKTGLCTDTVREILRKFSIYTVAEGYWELDGQVLDRWAQGAKYRHRRELDPQTGKLKTLRREERGEYPLFRLVSWPGHWVRDGRVLERWEEGSHWEQPPNSIVYLGDRMIDSRTAVIETQRLIALAEQQGYTRELWWQHVARIHGVLIGRYAGTEIWLKTFWKFCRIELESGGCGVPLRALNEMFPEGRGSP